MMRILGTMLTLSETESVLTGTYMMRIIGAMLTLSGTESALNCNLNVKIFWDYVDFIRD